MKIRNKVLLSVEESDIIDGRFFNDEVVEIADGCFNDFKTLRVVSLPKVERIGSYCFSYNAVLTSISLPVLTQCGSYCFRTNAVLTSISLPVLTQCGSDCFSYNAVLTSISLPVLTQCGSYCFRTNAVLTSISLPVLTQCGSDCFRYNDVIESLNIGKYNLSVRNVDGYCFVIKSEKSSKGIKILSGYNLMAIKEKALIKEESFVAEKDSFYAHGETVKKAISDLQFKIVAEKLRKEPIKPDTEITINHYRLVTGACEFGVKSWMAQNNIDQESIKAKDLLPILEKTNAYGLSRFKQLYQF